MSIKKLIAMEQNSMAVHEVENIVIRSANLTYFNKRFKFKQTLPSNPNI